MKTVELKSFGSTYIFTLDEWEKYKTLQEFFEAEEKYILSVKLENALEVGEDLLILFVRLYINRFAIPYFQFCHYRFPDKADKVFLAKILYACLIGRFIDDLVDQDSIMFRTYESIFLFQKYYPRLMAILKPKEKEIFDRYLFDSTKYCSPLVKEPLQFLDIEIDVYERIKYFFVESEHYPAKSQDQLKKFVGILLGGLDTNDLIADGYLKESSTAVSNHVYHRHLNNEGKLLLDDSLLDFYKNIRVMMGKEIHSLSDACDQNQLFYTGNILKALQR